MTAGEKIGSSPYAGITRIRFEGCSSSFGLLLRCLRPTSTRSQPVLSGAPGNKWSYCAADGWRLQEGFTRH